jgi:hypothetical protein
MGGSARYLLFAISGISPVSPILYHVFIGKFIFKTLKMVFHAFQSFRIVLYSRETAQANCQLPIAPPKGRSNLTFIDVEAIDNPDKVIGGIDGYLLARK